MDCMVTTCGCMSKIVGRQKLVWERHLFGKINECSLKITYFYENQIPFSIRILFLSNLLFSISLLLISITILRKSLNFCFDTLS